MTHQTGLVLIVDYHFPKFYLLKNPNSHNSFTHLLEGSIYLLKEGRFFIFKEDSELCSHVEMDGTQQGDG